MVRYFLAILTALSLLAGTAGASQAAVYTPGQPNGTFGFGIASVRPQPADVVGVAHPVVISFGAPVEDRRAAERAVDVRSSPPMTGRYEWVEPTVVQWVPDGFWPAHSTVMLSVGGRRTNFKTGPAVVGVASIADHTFTVTIDGHDAGPPSSLPAPHHRPQWGKEGVFPASMGRPQYPTPVGIYPVLAKERSVLMDSSSVGIPVNSPDGYLMRVDYAVRITKRGLFVHDAPWAVNAMGYSNVSHGCIGLSPEDAEWYFNTVNIGDPVIVRDNSLEVPSEPRFGTAY